MRITIYELLILVGFTILIHGYLYQYKNKESLEFPNCGCGGNCLCGNRSSIRPICGAGTICDISKNISNTPIIMPNNETVLIPLEQRCDTSLGVDPLGHPYDWTRDANPILTGMY
jgi:hypothetical protein